MKRHLLITCPPGGGKTTLIKKILKSLSSSSSSPSILLPGCFITEEIRDRSTGQRSGFQFVFPETQQTSMIFPIPEHPVALACLSMSDSTSSSRPKVGKYSVMIENVDNVVVPIMQQMISVAKNNTSNNSRMAHTKDSSCAASSLQSSPSMSKAKRNRLQGSTSVGSSTSTTAPSKKPTPENIVVNDDGQDNNKLKNTSSKNDEVHSPRRYIAVIDEIGKMECLSQGFNRALVQLMDCENVTLIATVAQRGTAFIESVKSRNDVSIVVIDKDNRDKMVDQIIGML